MYVNNETFLIWLDYDYELMHKNPIWMNLEEKIHEVKFQKRSKIRK
jgi:hypothetical protein